MSHSKHKITYSDDDNRFILPQYAMLKMKRNFLILEYEKEEIVKATNFHDFEINCITTLNLKQHLIKHSFREEFGRTDAVEVTLRVFPFKSTF